MLTIDADSAMTHTSRRLRTVREKSNGFTIVELLIVIVVIGILAAISLVAYGGVAANARDNVRKADIATIVKAMELYYSENGQYPVISPNGTTNTSLNPAWVISGDSSWNLLTAQLQVNKLPIDPTRMSDTDPRYSSTNFGYAMYINTSTYCGAAPRQMYILVYRLEASAQQNRLEGDCSTNPLLYGAASNYRMRK